ncbi:hypothetical protein Bca4012_062949 [Brassica carinata]|uniref:Uncharacterized protein n=1 Tax=Brassica carinata TaxID=52824 RepID=A0A8X7SCX8_BRACI|nr:hypothetical protein Bca52824_032539 [Brassica carinata]
MEIASTSSNLRYRFPTDQRYQTKDVGFKSTNGKERRDVVMETTKKRKHSNEEKPPEKRQKKTHKASVDAKAITVKFKKPVQSYTTLHVTKTAKSKVITTKLPKKTEGQDHSFKGMIAKAREKVQEKRQIDHRSTNIRSQRIAARLELLKLGYDFISDQVSCLYKFSLLSRIDYYIDESNSE